MTIGQRVKELRKQEKKTQQQISDILEIDRSNYSKYESGKLEFNNDMLVKLALFFGVRTDYLLGLED